MITNERRTNELSELYQSLSHSKWFRAATCRSTVTERSSQGPEIAGKKPALARRAGPPLHAAYKLHSEDRPAPWSRRPARDATLASGTVSWFLGAECCFGLCFAATSKIGAGAAHSVRAVCAEYSNKGQ